MELTMSAAGLVTFIAILTVAIVDLGLVLFGGTQSTVSQFLITTAFKSPLVTFAFGATVGHLFMFMYPMDCTVNWTERLVVAACGAVIALCIEHLVRAVARKLK